MTVLVLGAAGLLGNAVFRVLSESGDDAVFGTIRSPRARDYFVPALSEKLVQVDNLEDEAQLLDLFDRLRPTVVINCVALAKTSFQDAARMFAVFGVFPRRLQLRCRQYQVRLIQIGSDGVFSGKRGGYTEDDLPDADDLYGQAKMLGDVEGAGAITLRTSIIGHELGTRSGLLEWFLAQGDECRCFNRAIFSGFPSVALARLIRDVVLPRTELEGIYHVATQPISKCDLLRLIAEVYGKITRLVPDDNVVIDRALSSARFMNATGYSAPDWPELIELMHSYKFGLKER